MAKKRSIDSFEQEEGTGGETGTEYTDRVDFYSLYLEELSGLATCTQEEELQLLASVRSGDQAAAGRLVEARLRWAVGLAEEYRDRGLSMSDLVQEANVALLLAVREYRSGEFEEQAAARIREALEEALQIQDAEVRIEEETAARVNVLKDISAGMANELGREATVAELAERMRMTEEEIKHIMKLTLDAMSVSGN